MTTENLGDDEALPAEREAVPRRGEQERQQRRNQHMADDALPRHVERPCHVEQVGGRIPHALTDVHDHERNAGQYDGDDRTGVAEPEGQAAEQRPRQVRHGEDRHHPVVEERIDTLDSPIAIPIIVPRISAMTMPMANRCNEIANVSYRLYGATVWPVISSHMKLTTCNGVGQHIDRERPDGGDQLDRQQPEHYAHDREQSLPVSELRVNHRRARPRDIVGALMT